MHTRRTLILTVVLGSMLCIGLSFLLYPVLHPQRALTSVWRGPMGDGPCSFVGVSSTVIVQIIFSEDMTFTLISGDLGCSGTYRLIHQAAPERIEMDAYGRRVQYQYVIAGNTLTLIDEAGQKYHYTWKEAYVCEGSAMC